MSLSIKKKQEIYDYYSENGFQHSTEQIVKKLNICHKTFFNRYGSKSNSIEIAWNYWQDLCREKWTRILENCNHCIEELLIIIYNIYKTKEQNVHYYEFTRDSRKYREITREPPHRNRAPSLRRKQILINVAMCSSLC